MRLLAWSRVPRKEPKRAHELFEPFDCYTTCMRVGVGYRQQPRSELGCTRFDLHPVPWDVQPRLIRKIYLGRDRLDHAEEGVRNPAVPPEVADEGCPGGWYRCRFIWSLVDMLRIRTESGGRVQNPFFDTCEDPLVWAWVMYFERQQEEMAGHRAMAVRKDLETDSK